MEKVRKHQPTNQQTHHKATLEPQGPNISAMRYWGAVGASGLRTIGHGRKELASTASPQNNCPVTKTTPILPRGHTVLLPYPECSLPVDRGLCHRR